MGPQLIILFFIIIILVLLAICRVLGKDCDVLTIGRANSDAQLIGIGLLVVVLAISLMPLRFMLFNNLFWLLAIITLVWSIWFTIICFKIDSVAGWLALVATILLTLYLGAFVFLRILFATMVSQIRSLMAQGIVSVAEIIGAGLPADLDLSKIHYSQLNTDALKDILDKIPKPPK